jgi:twitching motility protein PilI
MNDSSEKSPITPRRWLKPNAALNRFKPPPGQSTGIANPERERVRYGFRIGGISLLVGQNTSSEVLERVPVYPLPKAPTGLLGLVNLRGNLVPIFDIKPLLELDSSSTPDKNTLLILGIGEKAVGILIDGLPQPAVTHHVLSRLPPLPVALRPHIAKAYIQDHYVWLEFDHFGFFETLGGHNIEEFDK